MIKESDSNNMDHVAVAPMRASYVSTSGSMHTAENTPLVEALQ